MFKRYRKTTASLILPPLLLGLVLWPRLPAAFSPEVFWSEIPRWIGVPENVLRITVFSIPTLFPVGWQSASQRWGWVLYGVGVVAYGLSYAALIISPDSRWSTSILGFTAPAWTPLLWLMGIGYIAGPAYFPFWPQPKYYRWLVLLFVAFHVGHAAVVHRQLGM